MFHYFTGRFSSTLPVGDGVCLICRSGDNKIKIQMVITVPFSYILGVNSQMDLALTLSETGHELQGI